MSLCDPVPVVAMSYDRYGSSRGYDDRSSSSSYYRDDRRYDDRDRRGYDDYRDRAPAYRDESVTHSS